MRAVIGPGFAEAGPDKVLVLTEHFVPEDDIDPEATRESMERERDFVKKLEEEGVTTGARLDEHKARLEWCEAQLALVELWPPGPSRRNQGRRSALRSVCGWRSAVERSWTVRFLWLPLRLEVVAVGRVGVSDEEQEVLEPAPARPRALDQRPPRILSILLGLALLVVLALAVFKPRRIVPEPTPAPLPAAPTGPSPADQLASAMAELQALPAAESLPLSKIHEALEGAGSNDKGFKLPDGRPPPALPPDAPRAVRIGLVLIRYQGSQLTPANAPSRDDALTRAQTLATIAKADFATAVRGGDPGSSADIGAVQRGILEPGTQYVVFTSAVGSVSEILDTPRGFWIVKRLK